MEFLRNPLLLSMFIMAFESHPEIPKRKSAFYRNVFNTLYSRHDGITKNSFPREKLIKLQRDDFEYILSVFSYLTLIEGQYSFTEEYLADVLQKVRKSTDFDFVTDDIIYDFRTSISILVLDGFEYYFPHRSMQEYFTALFINKLPTDRKFKAYENLSNILKDSSTDYSFTFWSLCFELDESVFISSFLIPRLREIYDQLENKNGRELVVEYFKLINATVFIGDFEKKGESELRIFRRAGYINAILDFCEIYDYKEIWKYPKEAGCHEEFKKMYEAKLIEEKRDKKGTSVSISLEMIDLLIKNGIEKKIEKIKEMIVGKITAWEEIINRKKSNIDELLG
jgi:hypothetical protein